MIDDADFAESTLKLLAYQALKAYPLESLHALIDDPDVVVRSAVARELQIRGEEETFALLKLLVTDERDFVREVSAFMLGQLGAPVYPFRERSLTLLVDLTKDSSAEVRAAAVAGLGHLSADEAIEVLVAATRDPFAVVRMNAVAALGGVKSVATASPILKALISDPDHDVRDWARFSLDLLSNKGE